jgi:glycosyltransferase involved in cell wall biosynthesis
MIFKTHDAPERRWDLIARHIPVIGWRLCSARKLKWAVAQLDETMHALMKSQNFDVLLFSGREALTVLKGLDIPIVVDCGDANCTRLLQQVKFSSIWQRPRLLFRYFREKQMEKRLARASKLRFFVSSRDRVNLMGPDDDSEVITQGVDGNYWKRNSPPSEKNCIVFTGVMNYPPNEDAALFLMTQILPLVRLKVPALKVLIVGREPSQKMMNVANAYQDTTVVGEVPDIRPYLNRADIFVAALRFASGVQNKVLEAMAMEVPVITTQVVVDGLRIDGIEPPLVTADSATEIADAIVDLLTQREKCAALSVEGRRFIEAYYSWSASAEKLSSLCETAAGLEPQLAGRSRNFIYR